MEKWKDIEQYKGFYQVSNKGRVRSLDRVIRNIKYKGIVLKPIEDKDGYKTVFLCCPNRKRKLFKIHRLVALSFINVDKSEKYEVNHIDGHKDNNCQSNLEWVTTSENMLHAYKIGLKTQKHELNNASKLNEDAVRRIRLDLKRGIKQQYIADEFNVSQATISLINCNKLWN